MSKSSNRFVHSVKVPRLYKIASSICQKVVEEGGSLKNLIYSSRHKNIKGLYALVVETIKHSKDLDEIIGKSKLLQNETRLQPWLARILITELIFGKKNLKGDSKPIKTVLSYKTLFEKLLKNNKNGNRNSRIIGRKPRYVRVNTLRSTPDEIIKKFRNEGWNFIPPAKTYSDFLKIISNLEDYSFTRDFHIKELLVFPCNVKFYNDEMYKNGSILLQDKASCLPAFLLKPKSNSVVLDMCAAPGMKTTHLSALMKNKGRIIATELDLNRYKVLCDIVQKVGCKNVTPINEDALNSFFNKEDNISADDVEYILVDPSCSGSGISERLNMFQGEKHNPKRLKKLCGFQFKLLSHALTDFPNAKRVVYSTCSILSQENEQIIEDVLTHMKNLIDKDNSFEKNKFKLVEPLKDSWPRRGSNEFEHGKCCIFSHPEKDLTNGFFIAVFERDVNNIPDLSHST